MSRSEKLSIRRTTRTRDIVISESGDKENLHDGSDDDDIRHFTNFGEGTSVENFFGVIGENDDDNDSGDDIWNEENDPITPNSTEDELSDDENWQEDRTKEKNDAYLYYGKTFNNAEEFKHDVLWYSLKSKYDIQLNRGGSVKIGAKCSREECDWRVYCSIDKSINKLVIKTFEDKHVCTKSGTTKMLKVPTIANIFEERLRRDPNMGAKEMKEEIKRVHQLKVTEVQCQKAKTRVLDKRKHAHNAQFARLWDYEAEIHNSNPGSSTEIEIVPGPTIGEQRFLRFYVCFETLRTSWMQYCRPIIGSDGTFLRWDVINGQLLAAVGRDADNRIYPIAWVVVQVENTENWGWFIRKLKADLQLGDGNGTTLISDKQKGLLNFIQAELPHVEHRMCARHIYSNWSKNNKDKKLKTLFYRIAGSYNVGEFTESLELLQKLNPESHRSLIRRDPTIWCRAYFRKDSLCADILNNLSESFNWTMKKARSKPLIDMLEDIRRQTMVRIAKRSMVADKFKGRLTKKTLEALESARVRSTECVRYLSTGDEYEVDDHGTCYRVNLMDRTCACRRWDITGLPCHHAICVINEENLKVDDYVSDYYLTSRWQDIYRRSIRPLNGVKLWKCLERIPIIPLC